MVPDVPVVVRTALIEIKHGCKFRYDAGKNVPIFIQNSGGILSAEQRRQFASDLFRRNKSSTFGNRHRTAALALAIWEFP